MARSFSAKATTNACGAVLIFVLVGCSTGQYQGVRRDHRTYVVVEQGRVLPVAVLEVRHHTSPFDPWAQVLVEICGDSHSLAQAQAKKKQPVCLKTTEQRPSESVARAAATELQPYRNVHGLIRLGCYLNRYIGATRTAWIVSTSPFSVAFLAGPGVDPAFTAATGGADKPSGQPHRYARLISEAQVHFVEVDTVLLFPDKLVPKPGGGFHPNEDRRILWADLLALSKPTKLTAVMDALSRGRDQLIATAATSTRVGVSE